MRLQCSPMVKLILFFIQVGPICFSSYYFFLISVSSISHSCSHFSALSLPLLDVSASLSNETQAGASSQVDLYCSGLFFFLFSFFSFIFLVCDLMLNSAVVVWVMDLAFWVVVWCASTILWVWVCGFGFMGLGLQVCVCGSSTWSAWIVDLIGLIGVGHWEGERERRRKK